MYKNVLVPVFLDDVGKIEEAVSVARQLADSGGKVTLLHVVEEIPAYVESYIPSGSLQENVDKASADLAGIAKKIGGKLETRAVEGHAGRTILDEAKAAGSDCIVVYSHRPGIADYFLGSTAARVVRHATCAVHVMR